MARNGKDEEDKGPGSSASVIVDSPVGDVYEYWRTLENLPQFLAGVEEVRPTGPGTTHWIVKGPLGAVVEFDATITRDEPEELLAWASTDGPQFSGEARFEEVGPGVTRVELSTGPGKSAAALKAALRRFAELAEGPPRHTTQARYIGSGAAMDHEVPHRKGTRRKPGSSRGRLVAGPHFDDPLPEDLLRAFEGEDGGPGEGAGR